MGEQEPVVAILAEEWGAIDALLRGLEASEWELPTECPGWTVRDVVSHLVGTERSLLGDPEPERPSPAPAHVRNPVGAGNEAWVAARRSRPGAEVAEEFRAVTGRRLSELRAAPAERFAAPGPSPVGVVPYREFMHVRVMDCWVHEQDIRVATGRPGHDDGPAARLSLDRLASGLPFVVGKQAAAPEGSAVTVDVRGPLARRVDIVVRDGRAVVRDAPVSGGAPGRPDDTVHSDDTVHPDVTLHMDTDTFWRLTCGRMTGDAARHAGLVTLDGDGDLGDRVLGAMAFMI
ncbi:MAG TPA: maleylpyruvate isomerase family mycothiol-dependent enzyme [Acidimicrobiales bacterium]|nr:maleylpyruvate isomerase family mycothiol-dependent enzyme [Acidimicrobiales bacterium]